MSVNSRSSDGASQNFSRRGFVRGGASLLGASFVPERLIASAQNQTDPGRRVLHLIGNSHIDAAWLWPWKDSSDLVLTTFRSALDRLQETPEFRFTHSSMTHYRWVQQADPGMFDEILHRIREGRWNVVGGWPVEPDCNIPSTESFARHCLYGKRYAAKNLNVDVKIGYNPDSFGHGAGLPTILKRAGYGYYVFLRPQDGEMKVPRLFWWEGPDGSRVLTCHIYGNYDLSVSRLRDAVPHAFPEGSRHGAFFFGVGDHGGAVTKAQIKELIAMRSDTSLPELRFSTVADYFRAVEGLGSDSAIPVIRGELQHHARGCYSACGDEKYQNRRAEQSLVNAETVASVASRFYARPYPTDSFAGAWERVLFNQFHDLLAGTSLYSDYEQARDGLGYACQLALESKVINLEVMAKHVDLSDVPESAVFVYNELPWARKALLEYRYNAQRPEFDSRPFTHLKAKDGTLTPVQVRPSDSMSNFFPRLSAWVDLPACGYKVFTVEHGEPSEVAVAFPRPPMVSANAFGFGSLLSDDGTELLAGELGLVVIEDKSDTWAHDIATFSHELGRPRFLSSEVVETGGVTRVTRQKLSWRDSSIMIDIAEYAEMPGVELRFVIDWHEHEQILKLEVPTALASPKIVAKVPGAAIERLVNGEEEPYQDWVAVQGTAKDRVYSVALMNSGSYSYDCLEGRLRTILVRSAPYARHNPNKAEASGINAWQDQGRQERSFWLMAVSGAALDRGLDREARAAQTPAQYVLDSRHGGSQPWQKSFLEVTPAGVEVLAMKAREDGSGMVVRLQERTGKQTKAFIICEPLGIRQVLELSPWELRTLSLSSARGTRTFTSTSLMES